MLEEHKLNKAIKQEGIKTQTEILKELKLRYPQYVEQSNKKQVPVRKRRFALISAIATVFACVLVIVPCVVLLPNRNHSADDGGNENIRYCAQGEYEKSYVDYTIADYRKINNLKFLYFDWYEFGEDRKTVCYVSNSDNEVLCIEENMYNPFSDEVVQLSITKSNVYLSVFDSTIANTIKEQTVNHHTVKWLVNKLEANCIFEDNGYRYFIQIKNGHDERRLFELVTELFETK